MQQFCKHGSVRGAASDGCPYRDLNWWFFMKGLCRATFLEDTNRLTYLQLLRQNLADAAVRLLGWCLMSNHLHLIALPERADSLSVLLRWVHGRYAQYFNAHAGRTGHLWQNRFFACVLGESHLWSAMAYVERNPVRAGMVREAGDYRWSSAAAHLTGADAPKLLRSV